ncbi:nucleoside hydrolase-like domain-containing protein [Lewinella sp. IMCC34183]|uniref:nucleoside hydrolase-like domain-containing protein n=1 Tax=Lewinella sp. IMCC34183 TaxID=2248762 RepID=UPI000E21C24E|nr:nucleoside hydrolase-like domain-containing protein [Lewinella sp. IMCC34183]
MHKLLIILLLIGGPVVMHSQAPVPNKPRVLVSTDIGGTDPDDNQSMAHLLMYSDRFTIEGLVSSPSYGAGSSREILRMIHLYEQDLPKLQAHGKGFATPRHLRAVTKQGRRGAAPHAGYSMATEGSDWIISCARKPTSAPLWIQVWGGLDDVAQALHDAPDIADKIRIYWIGGPNKKWSVNSYAYVAAQFPELWFIEVNSSYYGFFSDNEQLDRISTSAYYKKYIKGGGHLGEDFINYYGGQIKMGDTPSLPYLMDGDPTQPGRESWGGSFIPIDHSSRVVYEGVTSRADTVAFCAVVEFHFSGPHIRAPPDSVCFSMEVGYGNTVQTWPGYYLGDGQYTLRYAPKKAEVLAYRFASAIPALDDRVGELVISNTWPADPRPTDFPLGDHWYTDRSDPELYDGAIQGGLTIGKWREAVLMDWAERWRWLGAGGR